ncbi:hypothetical protein [Methanobacterium sp. ACI-7]|uniref:hypothetical protein n=1 Tax=unclassified Methanobacterium TaxID=2627676 RepID=UPI0039C2B204
MIKCKLTDDEIRRSKDSSNASERIANDLGRQILERQGYDPKVIYQDEEPEDIFVRGTDYGKDDFVFIDEIPSIDSLKFKEIKSLNKDAKRYIINYKAHQFADDEVNIMLMKYNEAKNFYTYERFYRRCASGKGESYRLQGLLSREKETDLCFFIKWATTEYYPDKEPYSLVNGYIIPMMPLRKLVLNNLNLIRETNGLRRLYNKQNNLKRLFSIYETWEHYRESDIKTKGNYPFELFIKRDNRRDQIPSLMMKIPKNNLNNYILVDENGDIVELKP